ncbi:hypothetical protein BX666DRAFT_1988628 [Dichotomocladium elegans]|nr:hypothetical protein BX666DRAFT_1988628 [Dichotomocladium elegans]
MKTSETKTTPVRAVRRSSRVRKMMAESNAKIAEEERIKPTKNAEKATKKTSEKRLAVAEEAAVTTAVAESAGANSSAVVPRKKTALKRKRSVSTLAADPEHSGTTEPNAKPSDMADPSMDTTTQEATDPSAPAAGRKKQRTKSKKAAAAAAMTVPIPEDSTAAELAELMQVQARLRRALSQRMYVISRERKNAYTETFDVLGSIGNLYKVTVGPKLGCSCRDFRYRRVHCKHIFLVLARVFHLTGESRAYQRLTLTPNELELIFSCCTPDPCVLANEQIQQAIKDKREGKPTDTGKRRPLKEADCPICYEELDESDISQTVFCSTCGNNIHKSCFEQWSNSLKSRYQSVTCVFCRSEWVIPGPANLKKNKEGYVNFQMEAGLPATRDTSTYGEP